MNFMQRGDLKRCIFIVVIIIILIVIINVIQLIVYKPVKYGIYEKDIDINREYVVCEYVEVTGFFWRMNYNNSGKQNKYIKLIGIDPKDICSNQILYGENTFILYGEYVENTDIGVFKDEDYVTFMVKDWDVLKPVKRLDFFLKPSRYLYKDDFVDEKS